ncbi:unnamed protein product [Ilex paraguariensis]|uniref:Glucan endo-1,3-beta-D-glucosidase n=1 Tax=Ilex paraguariensis TaxID=185542 RepID=A0ABC8TRB6_9AQUA
MKGPRWNTFMFLLTMAAFMILLLPCKGIGVCYGRNGNNLPSPRDVIGLYKRCGIQLIRLFEPNPQVLDALRGSNLLVSLGVRNEDLSNLASSQTAATAWVNANVLPYKSNVIFRWITLGNEVIPGSYSTFVARSMANIYNAIRAIGLTSTKVTTVVPMTALASSYPPSAGAFSGQVVGVMRDVVTTVVPMTALASSYPPSAGAFSGQVVGVMRDVASFLSRAGAPLMINVYPYFAFASDPQHVSLEYATFRSKQPVVDGNLRYNSLFDAMVDAFHAALEKINSGNVSISISETGWPTAGNGAYTNIDIAKAYNTNLVNHVKREGTPRRPNQLMDTFIFAIFNENQKENGVEQNWGLFYPNMKPVYPFFANCLR